MKPSTYQHPYATFAFAFALTSVPLMAAGTAPANPARVAAISGPTCEGYGPQTPRDIDNLAGENKRIFTAAPNYKELNLCNIHFHANAEHKAKDFLVFAGEGEHGGFPCNMSKSLSKAELVVNPKLLAKIT